MVQRERLGKKISEPPRGVLSVSCVTGNAHLGCELAHRLAARAARRRGLVSFAGDRDLQELLHPPSHCSRNSNTLSAERFTIHCVFDVASAYYLAGRREQRRSHPKP